MLGKDESKSFLGIEGAFRTGLNCYISVGNKRYYAGICCLGIDGSIVEFVSMVPTGMKRAYKQYKNKNPRGPNMYRIHLTADDYDQIQMVMIMQKYFIDLKEHYEKLRIRTQKAKN